MIILPEHDPTFPNVSSAIKENEEEIFNNSGISTHKLWFPNKCKPADWTGVDMLSKGDVWRRN